MAEDRQISVITVSRQMGSLGAEVAKAAADLLGFRLAWREVVNEAAWRAGVPEMALATFDDLGLLEITPSLKSRKAYNAALEEVMGEIASAGNVIILGRAGQVILSSRPDTLHIRVIAPLELRAARAAKQQHIAADCARAQVEASDHHRRSFLRRFYKAHWDDPDLYDLILNTAHLSVAEAAGLIAEAARPRPHVKHIRKP